MPVSSLRGALGVALVLSFANGCRGGGRTPQAQGDARVRAALIDQGAAAGAALRCEPETGACAPFARGDELALPARVKTTRGARARLDLGDGAALDLGGDATVLVTAGARRRVTVEQGAATISGAR
ncbi:MAG TPA: hypothetical protein VHB21_19630, partial [Minicystis sp.]|nr:hypothetical protein [Minicystis sp.]